MEIKDFSEKFAGCLNTVPSSGINATTQFKKLEDWSSIMALIVIAMIDSEYGKTLTADDIRSSETIEDLFTIIRSK